MGWFKKKPEKVYQNTVAGSACDGCMSCQPGYCHTAEHGEYLVCGVDDFRYLDKFPVSCKIRAGK